MDYFNGNKEISTKEFQRKLFDWFEKRGLLSELRAFMRHRMISALYSSESPCPASHFSTETAVSPTLQAMLLLVAEFLVQQEYHYTMSVMVAEAPLLASFPKFSGYVSYMSQTDTIRKGSNFPRYSEKDVQEILEVLGMSSNSESMEHVLRLYTNNNARESLLACVLTALSAIVQNCSNETHKQNKTSRTRMRNINDVDDSTQWIEEIRLILLRAQLTSGQLQQVEDLIRKLHADTANRTRKEERERNNKLNHVREQELLAAALVREETFRAQTKEADEDLRGKQKHLEQVSLQLRQQHDEVLNRLTRVQKHADEVKKQENELAEREKALERKQAMIEEEHHTLSALRAELQDAAHSLRQEHSDTKTIFELSRLQDRCLHLETELKETRNQLFASSINRIERGIQATEIPEPDLSSPQKGLETNATRHEEQHSSGSSLCSSIEKPPGKREKNSQVTLLKRVLQRIQQENTELKAIAAQQRRRIDELTSRATQLANYVAEQSDIPSLVREERLFQVPEKPTQPPPLPPRYIGSRAQSMPAGDVPDAATQQSYIPPPYSPRVHGKDWRRKPKRSMQLITQSTSLSSDESPTEEVLREVRNRLKKLEEESEVVDQRYRDFRARQADCLSSSAPVSFAPREQIPAKLPTGQSFSDAHNLSTGATYPLHQAQFPSPVRYGPPHTSAVRAPTSTVSGLTPNFSVFRRSQIPMPERSIFSLSQMGNPSHLSETMSSVPYYSSALRRSTDGFRNLIGSQSSFMRSSSTRNVTSETNQSVPPVLPTREKKVNLHELKSSQDVKKISLNPISDKTVSQDVSGLPEQQEISNRTCNIDEEATISRLQQVSILNPLPTNEVHDSSNKQMMTNISIDLVEPHASFLNVEQPSGKPVPSPKAPVTQTQEHVSLMVPENAFIVPLVPMVETDQLSGGVEPLPSPHLEKENVIEHHSALVEQPNPPHAQAGEIMQSPERQKTNFVDTTLNEVSTLSSSAGVSITNAGSVKAKITSGITVSFDEGDQETLKASAPTSAIVENKNVKEVHETSNFSPTLLQHIEADSTIPGRASQLLNTSLSSIENSERKVSAGSGGKGTDDDDDFW
ncbi:uncharacterized protein LOC117645390 [Thrips palmi]|uniref:Uncharacterized protein LOC117645390 n=1 Tax=Thrips palmi TaxID=161013 RepID=A0A6P8YV90_THRPL|nr:uncharacterized protein LOC117645390 [Thrips palmi]XP_034241450.1 uncharacterized protein LOC117645390 [Thrips palmi]